MTTSNDLTLLTLNQKNLTDFAGARNELLKGVKTKWAFFVDSDEEITPELNSEIAKITSSDKYDMYAGFRLKRRDIFLGRALNYGENGHNQFIRLVRPGRGTWHRPVHEVFEAKGRVGQLNNPLVHHLGSTTDLLKKINIYSTPEAKYRFSQGRRSTLAHCLFFPFGKFFKNYLALQGFRDGIPGFIMAGMMSFHSFLTWSKLLLLSSKTTNDNS
jgi:glycosyltransferase involved in cell wall biosynthesis